MISRVEVDGEQLRRLNRALRSEVDGRELKRDLARELRAVATPARDAARAKILSSPSRSTREPHLRPAIARSVQISVSLARGSVAIRAGGVTVRDFTWAPKRFNDASFRHPVHGNREKWVTQVGEPQWFDGTLPAFKPAASAAAAKASDGMAERIGLKTKG